MAFKNIDPPYEGVDDIFTLDPSYRPCPNLFDPILISDPLSRRRFQQELRDAVKQKIPFAVDTETTGLRVDRDKIIGMCFSIFPWKRGFYCPMYNSPEGTTYWRQQSVFDEMVNFFGEVLESDVEKRMHNKGYDIPIIYHNWGIKARNVLMDTMLLSHTVNPDNEHGLKENAIKIIHPEADWYEAEKDRYNYAVGGTADHPKLWLVPLRAIGMYGGGDAVFTGQIGDSLYTTLQRTPDLVNLFEKLVMPLSDCLMDIRIHGCPLDKEYLQRGQAWFTTKLALLDEEILTLVGDPAFNPASPDQLRALLFTKLKLPGGKSGKRGYSTDKDELERLRGMNPVSDKIIERRSTAKLKETYFDGLLTDTGPDGSFRGDIMQHGTRTGRISASRIHQIPRGPLIRSAFVAGDGYVLVGGDHAQLEARVLGHFSGDVELCGSFQRGEDVHSTTTKLMWKDIITCPVEDVKKQFPEWRAKGKSVNFALFYLESVAGLMKQVGCTWDEAKDLYDRFFASYTAILPWARRTIEEARKLGYIHMISGRRRYLPELNDPDYLFVEHNPSPRWPAKKNRPECYAKPRYKGGVAKSLHFDLSVDIREWDHARADSVRPILKRAGLPYCDKCSYLQECYYTLEHQRLKKELEHYERVVCNSIIQGSAGDLTNCGIVRTGRMIQQSGIEGILTNYVHDEVVYRIRTDMNVDQFILDYQKTMESPSEYLRVPLSFQPTIAKNWAELKD